MDGSLPFLLCHDGLPRQFNCAEPTQLNVMSHAAILTSTASFYQHLHDGNLYAGGTLHSACRGALSRQHVMSMQIVTLAGLSNPQAGRSM